MDFSLGFVGKWVLMLYSSYPNVHLSFLITCLCIMLQNIAHEVLL
jgi:hypothetical protein